MFEYLKQFKEIFLLGAGLIVFILLTAFYVELHRVVKLREENESLKLKIDEIVLEYNNATEKLKEATIVQANKVKKAELAANKEHKQNLKEEGRYYYIKVPSDCLLSIKYGTLQAINLAEEWRK